MNLNSLILGNIKSNKETKALIDGKDKANFVTYNDFLEKCLTIISLFKLNNLKSGDKIFIPGIKTKDTYTLIIASVLYGITYTVYDPFSPDERLEKIINSLKPKCLLSINKNEKLISKLNKNNEFIELKFKQIEEYKRMQKIDFNSYYQEIKNLEDRNLNAYIMFTSGSTGLPKGAIISRKNLLEFIIWIKEQNKSQNRTLNTNVNPLYFDNSVFDIYSSLALGHSLIFYDLDDKSTFNILKDDFFNFKFDQWFSVPSLLIKLHNLSEDMIFQNKLSKNIIFGGEGFSSNILREMINKFKSYRFINVYGPTECTCIATMNEIKDNNFDEFKGLSSLGSVIRGFAYEIINKDNNEIGELLLEGNLVGKGYINSNSENLKRFSINKKTNKRTYLTGDLVKSINGELYHCGRIDNQIKRMGYRIELEEIEYILLSIDEILDAAAVFKKESKRSFLFVVLKANINDKRKLIKSIKKKLPNYMFPDDILVSKQLLRNRNGKLDRNQILLNLNTFNSLIRS